jgi:phospholipid transport system substrate-binding protein
MRKMIPIVIGIVFMATLNIAQAKAQSAQEVVMTTADQVLARLVAERADIEANPGKLYSLINELVIPHFDFLSMSKWVLGKTSWRSASEGQREQFVNEFRILLVRTYAKALLEYSDEEIVYKPVETNPESNIVTVETQVKQSGGNLVPIDYRMHTSGGEWKVVDIVVDGISLVATYRGSFAAEIRKNGIDSLITKLTERNSSLTNVASQ